MQLVFNELDSIFLHDGAEPAAVAVPPLRRTRLPAQRGVKLALRGLAKSYGARTVLADINLDLQAGEFVAIVGRSGCGKSTLLRAIASLDALDGGEVAFGEDGGPADPAAMRIMFQEARLLPWKTVRDNVGLGLNAASGAAAALDTVGLLDRADEWPAALSGGQKQRVALARALVHEPQLLLLDEPLGALDALTRIEMQQLLASLWQARGFTAVLVTHDVQEAVALADRVILIEDGRITADIAVDLPRPRVRGSAAFAELEQRILDRVLGQHGGPADSRADTARDGGRTSFGIAPALAQSGARVLAV